MTYSNGTQITVTVHDDGTCSITASYTPDPPEYDGDPITFTVTKQQAEMVNAAPAGATVSLTVVSGKVTAVAIHRP